MYGNNNHRMDQAASVISQAGSALYVSFFPCLYAHPIPIPGTSTTSDYRETQSTESIGRNTNAHVTRATFVIAHTLVSSPKAVHAKTHYNLRVFESAVAARVLVHRLGLPISDKKGIGMGGNEERVSLRGVLDALMDREFGHSNEELNEDVERLRKGLERMIQEVECLRPACSAKQPGEEQELGVDLDTMIEWTGMSHQRFEDVYLNWLEGECESLFSVRHESAPLLEYRNLWVIIAMLTMFTVMAHYPPKWYFIFVHTPNANTVEARLFQLYKRAKHCYEEALRVLQFRDICISTSSPNPSFDSASVSPITALAALMNASQESCSTLYECTCPEIDLLTKLAREAGAYGSRVTGTSSQYFVTFLHPPIDPCLNQLRNLLTVTKSGAGWGGCTVSLVEGSQVDAFIAQLWETYPPYRDIVTSRGREEAEEVLRAAVFATKPSSGVCGECRH